MHSRDPSQLSLGERRASSLDFDDEANSRASLPQPISTGHVRLLGNANRNSVPNTHPKPLPTPNKPTTTSFPRSLLPSAPASPPTPAPSPTPHQRAPSWQSTGDYEDTFLRDARSYFNVLGNAEKQRFLAEVLNLCDNQQLSFVHNFVSPRLKRDPFMTLPTEICLRVWLSILVLKG